MASISQSLFVFFLLISYLLLLISAEPEETYSSHDCPPFPCGDQDMMIGFPFANITHPNCGVVIVDCSKKPVTIQLAMTDERRYQLTSLNRGLDHQPNAYVLGIRDQNLSENLSSGICKSITNSTIPLFYKFNPPIQSLTLLKCIHTVVIGREEFEPDGFQCKDNYKFYYHHPIDRIPFGCSIVHLQSKPGSDPYHPIVTAEFELLMHVPPECSQCHEGEVQCDLDPENKFICAKEKEGKKREVLAIALGTLFVAIGVLIVIGLSFRKKFRSINVINLLKKESLTHQSVETFLKNNGPFGIRRYSYSNIKKMTNFLRDKLGQGGYGSVYKGKLQDGSLVAVKVLKGSNGNGEEFINEVASISRTSHVNIVTLRGFCFEGSKRALVYEFMPNGSLEKFIYKKDLLSDHQLQWETLYKIAVGIARGLEYLHRGCNTRILHFDIKPHNILLDENFCPKISDFGLAKVCPREQSIISMLGTRGTAGYIAPEVFCRNIGGVSHKSDVYSYGMMVLEMLGGRKNIDIEVDHTSEIYFPHWIYRRLELNEELKLHGLMTEEDRKNAKKMTIVSLWCIQTDPSNRPTMSRVVEMLEMSLNSLRIPPKPFLSSPSRSGVDSSTIVALSPSGSIVP